MMNAKPKILLLVLLPLLFVIGSIGLCFGVAVVDSYLGRNDWMQRTTPLPKETIQTLCINFNLSEGHPLCNGKKDVYGPDFYEIIRNTFRPIEEYRSNVDKPATFDEVEAKIGAFKTGCEPVIYVASLNLEYFVCDYDLRGDGQFIIGIFYYYPENIVSRIVTPMGED